jgi:dTDP-N-acetylfucosamine:lipid II N-acetylfucosaminyltransferase
MIVHIITDSIFAKNLIKLIEKKFDYENHIFFIYGDKNTTKFLGDYVTHKNIIFSKSTLWFYTHCRILIKSSKVIVHQLNRPKLMLLFNSFKKLYWVLWGGDLFFYYERNKSIKNRLIELVRRNFIRRVKFVASVFRSDFELCSILYNFSPVWFKKLYPYVIDFDIISKNLTILEGSKSTRTIKILVGQSGSPTNNHIEVLNALSKYAKDDILLHLIVSYGGSEDYVKELKSLGDSLFRDKIVFIETHMDFETYTMFLNSMDICIFNHDIQEGLGNLFLLLYLRKKVFIRKGISTYNYLQSLNIEVSNVFDISEMGFEKFISMNYEQCQKNSEYIEREVSEDIVAQYWELIFNS